MSNLIFFAHIFVLWLLLDRGNSFSLKKKYILGILASVLLGLSFYTYLFAFSLLFAMNGFLWIYFLIKKDFTKLKQLTLIIVGALLLGASYILNMLQVFSSPYYADLSVRVGQVATTEFILSRVWFGIVFIYLFFYRKLNSFGVFTITLLLAFFAVSNVQVIIGRTIPIPEHYYWYYLAPFTGFILMHIGYTYIEKKISSNYLKY